MLRRIAHRRAGGALLELLLVLGTVATLMGLLLGGVMEAGDVAKQADTSSRMSAISNGIGTFKSERQVTYIPGGHIDDNPASLTYGTVTGPFQLRNSYPDK